MNRIIYPNFFERCVLTMGVRDHCIKGRITIMNTVILDTTNDSARPHGHLNLDPLLM